MIAAIIAATALSSMAPADKPTMLTADALRTLCGAPPEVGAPFGPRTMCTSYILGVTDAWASMQALPGQEHFPRLCLPATSLDAVRLQFIAYSAKHPESLPYPADQALVAMLLEEYACRP